MRGKESWTLHPALFFGITPAYAGKSNLVDVGKDVLEDHPRLCGEKALAKSVSSAILGSPPPMRGKVKKKCGNSYFDRITPAYAGKRSL